MPVTITYGKQVAGVIELYGKGPTAFFVKFGPQVQATEAIVKCFPTKVEIEFFDNGGKVYVAELTLEDLWDKPLWPMPEKASNGFAFIEQMAALATRAARLVKRLEPVLAAANMADVPHMELKKMYDALDDLKANGPNVKEK